MIKRVRDYWVDEHNNKWLCKITTEEQARCFSESLIDCYNCCECSYCSCSNFCDFCKDSSQCSQCERCIACHRCHSSRNCSCCWYCTNCKNCRQCKEANTNVNCIGCRRCDFCKKCSCCYHCKNLYGCENYKETPKQHKTPTISSRGHNAYFYYGVTREGFSLQVVYGAFRGDLKDFETKILERYKDNKEYRSRYLEEIEEVKILFNLER